jgi:SAM-dependent methyltransferase
MENSQQDNWYEWYQSFDETHSPQARRQWYNEAANAYSWARPRYPEALIDQVVKRAQLRDSDKRSGQNSSQDSRSILASSILEVGCGPGIATAAFAAKGFAMTCLEPSPAACELARQRCEPYEPVEIINSTFEAWPLGNQRFDAVLAATSFHWISPAIACQKSAAALKPNGSLILLWATPPQPSEQLNQALQPVYQQFDLDALGQEQRRTQAYYQSNFQRFAETVTSSGCFQATEAKTAVEMTACQSIYSIEKYLALLSTLSGYIALPATTRMDLLRALGDRLATQLNSTELMTEHCYAAQVFQREASA